MNKQCLGCDVLKDISSFNKKSDNADGYKNFCIACCLIRLKSWRNSNKEKRKKHDKEYKKKYPEKIIAKNALNKAVLNGIIIRKPCIFCGEVKSQGHHPNYSLPLEVIWLCPKHHSEAHQQQK